MKLFVVVWVLVLLIGGTLRAEGVSQNIHGYFKMFPVSIEDSTDGDRDYLMGNRLRLDGTWQDEAEVFLVRLIADQEVYFGNELSDLSIVTDSNVPEGEIVDLTWDADFDDHWILRENIYRAYVRGRWSRFDLTVGRQRIAWGQGRIWTPADVINPFRPFSIEPDERRGSDLVDVRWDLSELSFLEGVYIPKEDFDWDQSIGVGRARSNFYTMDVGVMGGKVTHENIIGFEHAAQLFEGSLRSEVTYTFNSEIREDFERIVVSYDYTVSFSHPWYWLVEVYHNGIGERDFADYQKVVITENEQPFRGKEYAGFRSTVELTSLVKLEGSAIVNLNDRSFFLSPTLHWDLAEEVPLVVGMNLFFGREGSEFDKISDLYFASIHMFF